MPRAADGTEFLAALINKRDRVLAANPQAHEKIMGFDAYVKPSAPRPTPAKPTFEMGRYISPRLTRLIELIARHADVSPEAIRGDGRKHRLVNARYCIANIAEEFAPRLSARAIDDGMLRGEGMTLYYRMRHRDRIEMYEDYLALYDRCRAELLSGVPQ
jgi:hypothetical protein